MNRFSCRHYRDLIMVNKYFADARELRLSFKLIISGQPSASGKNEQQQIEFCLCKHFHLAGFETQ